MNRRDTVLALFALGAAPLAAWAQQPGKVPVVGSLMVSAGPYDSVMEALRSGLRELGYVDGRNIRIEHRSAGGNPDRLPQLATELVQLKVDVIVAGVEASLRAAQQATGTIPIVMVAYDFDPVGVGLIANLSKPGGNITGMSTLQSELIGKRLEVLEEALPGARRVAVFWDGYSRPQLDALTAAARSLGVELRPVELRAPYNFGEAFKAARRQKVRAVFFLFSPVFYVERRRIAALALENRLPAMHDYSDFVEAGGLISYGPNREDTYGRAAYFIDRILKGAKPGDLPIEQPTKFELVVNLKTAKALGITFPESILVRADEVIK